MKVFEIWSEGFVCTGQSTGCMLHEAIEAETFQEACEKLAENNTDFKKCFDPKELTFWGCRLFDNEADASKAFG